MQIFQPIFWLCWIFEIFDGFTFTDWYDFVPLACLLIGLVSTAVITHLDRCPASFWLKGFLGALALWPLYPSIALFMLAQQVVKSDGHWPQVMIDDPKNLVGLSPTYDFWFHATFYFEAVAGAALVSFAALFLTNQDRLSYNWRQTILCICGVSMLFSIADPGHLIEWWMD